MSMVLHKDMKIAPFKHLKKQQQPDKIVDKCFERARILFSCNQGGMLPNFVFSDKKKFDIEHHFNTQNNRV